MAHNRQTRKEGFANGFECFCPDCGNFFSVQFNKLCDDVAGQLVHYCPNCGDDRWFQNIDHLLEHCADNDTDPVNFYHAFPPDEPIPNSRAGATPRQVEMIIGCVINDKRQKLPVTVESLAAQLGYGKEIVQKVFDELHITETR